MLNCRAKKLKSWKAGADKMIAVGSGIAARGTKGCFPNATKRMRRVAFYFVLFLTSLKISNEFEGNTV